MFYIADKFHGGDYYVREYQRIYDRFVWNLGIYAGDKCYRKMVLKEALAASDDVLKKAYSFEAIVIGGVGQLNLSTKSAMKRKYQQLFGED